MSAIERRGDRDFEADDDTSWKASVDGMFDDGAEQPVGDRDDTVAAIFNPNDSDEYAVSDTFVVLNGHTEVTREDIVSEERQFVDENDDDE